jgi:hypothetical protein
MRARRRLSRREIGVAAAALLLPVPLVALNGLAAALPAPLDGGLGSLVTLEAGDESSGVQAQGAASEHGRNERRAGTGTLSITRTGSTPLAAVGTTQRTGSGVVETSQDDSDSERAHRPPAGDDPTSGDDDGGSDRPGGDGDGGGEGGSGDSGSSTPSPGVSLTIDGPGSAANVSAGTDGITVDLGADSDGAGADDPGLVSVEITDTDGSSTSFGLGVPGPGSVLP